LLDLLETVVARASGAALVMCTARPELFEGRPSWAGSLPNASTVSLSPLAPDDGAALLRHLLGGPAPPPVIDVVLRRSEGNPFFAEELLRMMIEDGALAKRDDGWALVRPGVTALPDTVQGVIASRIDLLPPSEKRVIQDAAVIGRIAWVGALVGLGGGEAGSIDGEVDGLIRKGFLRQRETSSIEGERELIFHHVLTRDVAYAGIPRARRSPAHAAVLAWIEEATRGRDEEFAEICAHHAERAGNTGATARWSVVAGDRLRGLFSAEDAIKWYDKALAAAADDASIEGRAALGRGMCHEVVGRAAEAAEDYRRAAEFAARASDARLEAEAAASSVHALWLLDRFEDGRSRLPGALSLARQIGAADLEARLLYTAGTIRFGRGEFREALEMHREALVVASASGDREGEALAEHGLCETTFFLEPGAVSLAHGLAADGLLRELGQRQMVAHNAYMVAWNLGFIGRWDEALAMVDGSIAESREIGNERDEAFALFDRAELMLSDCRPGQALSDGERGLELFRSFGTPRGELVGLAIVNDVALETWDLDGLAERSQRASEISTALSSRFQRPVTRAFDGWRRLIRGDTDDARRAFAGASDDDPSRLDRLWSARVELLAWEWAREPQGLERVAAAIDAVGGETDVWTAWAPYARGLGALLSGKADEALAHAERCAVYADAVHERRLTWRAGRVAADALDLLGRPSDAASRRAEARRIAEASAADLPEGHRRSFLARPDVASLFGSTGQVDVRG
jgi:tetratricopeptide (TPR) repeat protein